MHDSAGCFEDRTLGERQASLRRLALALVRDEHAADDLVQDALVQALERPGAERLGLGWLSAAVKHLAFNKTTAERRRAERQRSVARDERIESAAVDRRLEHQALVVAAIQRLPEALRTVVYKRYFDELGPAQIAAELGQPLATIKSRLARAKQLLRSDLDRSFGGDRAAWMLALVPSFTAHSLTTPATAAATTSSLVGTIFMSTLSKVLIAAVACTGTFLLWRGVAAPEPLAPALVPAAKTAADEPLAAAAANAALDQVAQGPPAARAALEQVPERTEAPAAVADASQLAGLVLDADARPLAGVDVLFRSRRPNPDPEHAVRARTTVDGQFALEAPAVAGEVLLDDADFATVFGELVSPPVEREVLVIAAKRRALNGSVHSETGQPIEGANLQLVIPDGFRRRFGRVLDHVYPRAIGATTDASGAFDVAGAIELDGALLRATADGFMPLQLPLAEITSPVDIVLRRPGDTPESLHGIVVDALGRPVEDARVSFGLETTLSDEHGRFQLMRQSSNRYADTLTTQLSGASRTLHAVKRGYLPAQLVVERSSETGTALWEDGVLLQLGDAPLSIAGRVVDPDGAALAGMQTFLADAALFTLADGAQSIENLLGGDPEDRITFFETDAQGAFEIGGLQPRDYALVAMHPSTYAQVQTQPITAGTRDVRIVLDPDDTWDVLAGRVQTGHGEALSGVDVHVFTDATNFRMDGRFVRTSNFLVRTTTTAADGTFELNDVPKQRCYMRLMGDEIQVQTIGSIAEPIADTERDSVDDLVLVATRRVHFQVTLDQVGEADQIAVHDSLGAPLDMRVYQGKPGPAMQLAPVHADQTDVLSVSDAASVLLYLKDGVVVRRRPITLAFGELNEL